MNRYLLDTNALLWWADDPNRLSDQARLAISNGQSDVLVSTVTVWEIAIKRQLGKLQAPSDIAKLIADNRFIPLAATIDHALAVESLPLHHRDPFDRLLIAQARVEGVEFITSDKKISRYDVRVLAA